MSVQVLAFVLIGLLVAWAFAGMLLRLAGIALVLAGAGGLALWGNANGLLLLLIGAALWLAGHWHYALRHHDYKSPLASHLFCRMPAWLDPSRDWEA